MKKYFLFVGARPNFMKAAPLCWEFNRRGIPYVIFHSGQHWDHNLSNVFQEEFDLESDIVAMSCSEENPIKNIQAIMDRTTKILGDRFDEVKGVIVFGDVGTTLAVALAARHLMFPIIHVEAGLRSFDIGMPEELIRITTDHISGVLFSPSEDAVQNLKKEGRTENVHMVGNIMIDCLIESLQKIKEQKRMFEGNYFVMTIHRPENVDDSTKLIGLFSCILDFAEHHQIIFPMHPRTRKALEKLFFLETILKHPNIKIIEPLGYHQFMNLVIGAEAVITDSGGIQEETTFLNIPCFTIRKNTERPLTVTQGTNYLIDYHQLRQTVETCLDYAPKVRVLPDKWDGKTASRIADILSER